MPNKPSVEFEEKRKIIALQVKLDKEKHVRRMEELEFLRENEKMHHDHEMDRQRIKSSEIRKSQERKAVAGSFKY